jgi:hypothetical protein
VRERAGGLFQNFRRDLGLTRQYANDAAHLKYLLASLRLLFHLIAKAGTL